MFSTPILLLISNVLTLIVASAIAFVFAKRHFASKAKLAPPASSSSSSVSRGASGAPLVPALSVPSPRSGDESSSESPPLRSLTSNKDLEKLKKSSRRSSESRKHSSADLFPDSSSSSSSSSSSPLSPMSDSELKRRNSKAPRRASSQDVGEALSNQLTARDWELLMTGAKEREFKGGETLIVAHQSNRYIYRVVSGTLKIERGFLSSKSNPLYNISVVPPPEGILVGEISVLGNRPATASVIADCDLTAYRLKVPFCLKLFKVQPELARRFYRFVGCSLGKQLRILNASISLEGHFDDDPATEADEISATFSDEDSSSYDKSSKKTKSKVDKLLSVVKTRKKTQAGITDDRFRKRFGLFPADKSKSDAPPEILVKSFKSCVFHHRGHKRTGTLYLSQHFVCIKESFFGHSTKIVIEAGKIQVILEDSINSKTLRIKSADKNSSIGIEFATDDEYVIAHQYINEMRQLEPSPDMMLKGAGSSTPDIKKDGLLPSSEMELSDKDWKTIMSDPIGCTVIKYEPGKVIIEEGSCNPILCQITSGLCVVTRKAESGQQTLTTLGVGQMFGDLQFLTNTPASATVCAGASGVEIVQIDGNYLNFDLFKRNPSVVVRLYHHLCRIIAERIIERENLLIKQH